MTVDGARPWSPDEDRSARLAELDAAVDRMVQAIRAVPDPGIIVHGDWAARDVMAHIVFWHESFARNVADLVADRKPVPLAGTYASLAEQMRDELGAIPVEGLLERLAAAQTVIRRAILDPSLDVIPYRRGSRPYLPDEHLAVVRDHVLAHASELERAKA